MHVFFEFVDTNPADNCDKGYVPLYPLLKEYWDNPTSELPEKMRYRVKYVMPSWDDIDGFEPGDQDASQRTIRQNRVRMYDIKRDETQEWRTYIALEGYIRGGYGANAYPQGGYVPDGNGFLRGQLPDRIDKAKCDGLKLVADVLKDDVAAPLETICRNVGNHWPNPEPLLWKALFRFKMKTLPILIGQAEGNNHKQLVDELGYVSLYIHKILSPGRDLMGDFQSEWEANAAAQSSTVCVKLAETTTEKTVSKLVWEDDRLLAGDTSAVAMKKAKPVVVPIAKVKDYGTPPGKIPEGIIAITKLAIKAAWQIECDCSRKASAEEVIQMLREWVQMKIEADLIGTTKYGVTWMTTNLDVKPYEIDACKATLKNWKIWRG